MDKYVGEKAAGGHGFSSKGSGIVFRDQNHKDGSIQNCNSLGSGTGLNSMKGTQIGDLGKAKHVKANVHSTSGKTIAGNSSKSSYSYSGYRKCFHERRKQTIRQEKAIAESSNSQGNIEDSKCSNTQHFIENLDIKSQEIEDAEFSGSNSMKVGFQTLLSDSEELKLPILEQVSTNISESSGSCTTASSSKSHVQISHDLCSGNQDVSSRSFYRQSTYASRNSGNAASPGSQGLGTGAYRCGGLRSLICPSVSDVLPSGHSSSDFSHSRQIDAVRKRPSGGDNSAATGMDMIGPSTGGHSGSTPTGTSGLNRSLPGHLMRQQTSLQIRNQSTMGDGAISVRTCQASTGDSRKRLSEQEVGNILPVHEPITVARPQQNRVSILEDVPESSSRLPSIELPHALHYSSGCPGSSSRAARNRMVSCPEDSSIHLLHGFVSDRDCRRLEEVMLDLRMERISQLTNEQILALGADLFSRGPSLYDRHRDMRMDIDNMSYEELLALEEKMGTVNTGLSKDQLSEYLKRSIYTPASKVSGITGSDDDTKCSICQEAYVSGDEVGELACEHRFHAACIHQWLGLKNWCPICKASALPS